MKEFFRDLGVQVGAVVIVAAAIIGVVLLASHFMPAPNFPVVTYQVSAASCAGEDVTKRKCFGIDWKMLNQSLAERELALRRPFSADVLPIDYDALRQAGLLPR